MKVIIKSVDEAKQALMNLKEGQKVVFIFDDGKYTTETTTTKINGNLFADYGVKTSVGETASALSYYLSVAKVQMVIS